MNTNTILCALFNNDISHEDVRKALEIHDNFLTNARLLIDAGITVTTSITVQEPIINDVSEKLRIFNPNKVMKFKNENIANIDTKSSWPLSNKITLIKKFREVFGAGLADAKWAIENLYEEEKLRKINNIER